MSQPPFQPFGAPNGPVPPQQPAPPAPPTGPLPPPPGYAPTVPGAAYAAPPYLGMNRPNVPGGIASLVFGILGLMFCPLFSIPAAVMGKRALRRCDEAPGHFEGRGVAMGGFITGLIGVILWAVIIGFYAFFIIVGIGTGAFETVPA